VLVTIPPSPLPPSLIAQFVPRTIPGLARLPIAAIAAGAHFTLFLSTLATGGRLFACGEGRCGQLGQGQPTVGSDVPLEIRVHLPTAVSDATVAPGHAGKPGWLAGDAGDDWGSGRVDEGKEGKEAGVASGDGPLCVLPQRGPFSPQAGGAAVGVARLPGRLPALAADSSADSSGSGRSDGSTSGSSSTIDIRFKAVAAGGSHGMVLTASHHVFVWGMNSHGQLGLGDTITRHAPVLLRHRVAPSHAHAADGAFSSAAVASTAPASPLLAHAIAAGSSHSAAVTLTGELYTWGLTGDNRLGHHCHHSPAADALCRNTEHVGRMAAPLATASTGSPPARAGVAEADSGVAPEVGLPTWPLQRGLGPTAETFKPRASRAGSKTHSGGSEAVAAMAPGGRKGLAEVEAGTFQLNLSRSRSHNLLRAKQREYAVRTAVAASASALAPHLYAATHGGGTGSASSDDVPADGSGPVSEELRTRIAQAFARTGTSPAGGGGTVEAPVGGLSTRDLQAMAAAVGLRLRDIPSTTGAPWMRTRDAPSSVGVDVSGGIVAHPHRVSHPALGGRRLTGVACGLASTSVFAGG